MRDTEFYQQILGLQSPWKVARVELNMGQQRVDVWTEHTKPKAWPCPECGAACPLHDHDEERTWRHLDTMQFTTHLHARVPRVRCDEHGVRQVRVPWADPKSRFTLLFERLAIDVLREADIKGAAKILRISWDEAHQIMERAVARGMARRERAVPRRLGIDEKSLARGYRFATLVCDLDHAHVIEVTEGRSKASLWGCLSGFSPNELARVEAVAMDMWEPYAQVVRVAIERGETKIVFDKFHIAAHMNEAVDRVRRRENRVLVDEGDARLVGTKHMWLYAKENVPKRYRVSFDSLRATNLKTARAWAIKESLRDLWTFDTEEAGRAWWKRWHGWAIRSRLEPVRRVARMIRAHLPNVLSYFTHRITNAVSEAINSTIQAIKKRAFGFRSFRNFRTAVLFACGGLQLYPELTHPNP